MKYLLLILSMMFLGSCAKKNKTFYVNPELQSYYQSFINDAQSRGRSDINPDDLVMDFGSDAHLEGKTLAYCKRSFTPDGTLFIDRKDVEDTPKIIVDKRKFDSLDEVEKRLTIYHELGHCILKRDHLVAVNNYNFAKSLMYPYILTGLIGVDYYTALEPSYVSELFDPNAVATDPAIALNELYLRRREEQRTVSAHSKITVQEDHSEDTFTFSHSIDSSGKCNFHH